MKWLCFAFLVVITAAGLVSALEQSTKEPAFGHGFGYGVVFVLEILVLVWIFEQ
jgi:hypothetical protein